MTFATAIQITTDRVFELVLKIAAVYKYYHKYHYRIGLIYSWHTINVNPLKPSELFYLNSLDRSISRIRGVYLVFIIIMFCIISISEFNASSVDPDQTANVCQCPFYETLV